MAIMHRYTRNGAIIGGASGVVAGCGQEMIRSRKTELVNCAMYGAGYGIAGAIVGGFAGWGLKAVTGANYHNNNASARTYARPQARANDAWLNEEDMLI